MAFYICPLLIVSLVTQTHICHSKPRQQVLEAAQLISNTCSTQPSRDLTDRGARLDS